MTAPALERAPDAGAPNLVIELARRPLFIAFVVAAVGWVYFAPNYWVYTGTSAAIGIVAALGLWVLVGWAREISLAQAGLIGTGVYLCGYLYRTEVDGQGWPFLVALFATVAAVAALAVVTSVICVRLSGVYVVVLTLGLQFMIERVVFTKGELTGGIVPMRIPRPWFFGIDLVTDRALYFFMLGVLGVVLLLLVRLRRSRYGRSLMFTGSDRRAAAASGISPWRYKMFAFAICGTLAGLAGALSAPFFETPPPTLNYLAPSSLGLLAVPILAGVESVMAVVAVSVLLTVIPTALESLRISIQLLGGFGLIVGVMLGPRGLGGSVMDGWRKRRRNVWRAKTSVASDIVAETSAAAGPGGTWAHELATGDGTLDPRRAAALEVLAGWLPPRPDGPVALSASEVRLAFGGVVALDGVSLTVPSGQLVGLIGPNGAGKSTLFDVVNGLKRPDAGTTERFGQDSTVLRVWQRAELGMARTFQANRINLELSVKDNLLSGAHCMIRDSLPGILLGGRRSWAATRRAEEVAWAVAVLLDIDRHWNELAGALSYGNRRRVEIGRTLMAGPRLLLLDEPAAGLDPAAAGILFSLVKRLHQDLGLTVLLVEHYVRAVLANCDLVYVLSRGQVVAAGTPDEVAAHPDVRSQYLGADFDARRLAARRPG